MAKPFSPTSSQPSLVPIAPVAPPVAPAAVPVPMPAPGTAPVEQPGTFPVLPHDPVVAPAAPPVANRMMLRPGVWVRSNSRQPIRHDAGVIAPGGRALVLESEAVALGNQVTRE